MALTINTASVFGCQPCTAKVHVAYLRLQLGMLAQQAQLLPLKCKPVTQFSDMTGGGAGISAGGACFRPILN